MKIVFFLLFLVLNTALCSEVLSQEIFKKDQDIATLKGMKREQVLELIGKPDSTKGDVETTGKETWTYGRSLILFTDGIVSGWSNAGELRPRRNLARVKKSKNSEYDRYSSSWENDWTPQQLDRPEEVIEDIMNEMAEDEEAEGAEEQETEAEDYSSKSKLNEEESASTSSTLGKASSTSSPP